MKAMVQLSYGSPDVIVPRQIAKPSPRSDELLIRIQAAKVGPSDCAFRKGEPQMIKWLYGRSRPKYPIGGTEFAGVVEAVGAGVKHIKAGDRVLGMSPRTFGAYAEYLCLSEKRPLAVIPVDVSFEEAVAVCDGGATALTF
ncbi:MAG TPA: alcohol dehydrogenase catalytic domain-containing protein, partial [Paenibacillus sp.]|nr:alcohol dehydrogenase catalytic domain-containing protein [Paenibacillus sp.]